MSFDITGKLIVKYDTQKKSEKFSAREFVIEVADGQYPQMVKFQLTQDRCSLVDTFNVGEAIKVHFDLRGREWNGKYFTNLNAWRLEKPEASAPAGPPQDDTPFFGDDGFPSSNDEPQQTPNVEDLPF